ANDRRITAEDNIDTSAAYIAHRCATTQRRRVYHTFTNETREKSLWVKSEELEKRMEKAWEDATPLLKETGNALRENDGGQFFLGRPQNPKTPSTKPSLSHTKKHKNQIEINQTNNSAKYYNPP
ncbi:MAG: hypothetical protein Q9188_002874, partial [Gyalolechia gomerana]